MFAVALGIIILSAITLSIARYFDEKNESDKAQESARQQTLKNTRSASKNINPDEPRENIPPISDWEIYDNKQYGLKFKYPKKYIIESQTSDSGNHLVIRDDSGASIAVDIVRWTGLAIEEGTPGTFYAKISYNGHKYFVDNFNSIKTGGCDETIKINADPTGYEKPTVCLVTKAPNYIKIEMGNETVFHTKDLEVRFQLGERGDGTLLNEMASSLDFLK